MGPIWQALQREAGSAAQHLGLGATMLGSADYAQQASYTAAFFALSVGLERSCKLALVVDHVLTHGGSFPSNGDVKGYRHDLRKLLSDVEAIAARRGVTDARLPDSPIHRAIIDIIADFATNATRYYNIDLVTKGELQVRDPVPTGPVACRLSSSRSTVPLGCALVSTTERRC